MSKLFSIRRERGTVICYDKFTFRLKISLFYDTWEPKGKKTDPRPPFPVPVLPSKRIFTRCNQMSHTSHSKPWGRNR